MIVFGGYNGASGSCMGDAWSLFWGPTLDVPAHGPGRLSAVDLSDPWPNPSGRGVRMSLTIPAADRVELRILDVQGRVRAVVVDGPLAVGTHQLAWDGRDAGGAPVGPGVYFATLRVGRVTAY
jgi:hypothetical protein